MFLATDYALFDRRFDQVALVYPDFCFFELFDRQLLDFRYARLTAALRALDRWVWANVPAARRFSFHVVVKVVKTTP